MKEVNFNGKVYKTPEYLSLTAMAAMDIYAFRYFPKDRLMIQEDLTMKVYRCREIYTDMPYSFADDFVDDAYRDEYIRMYEKIDAGAEKASVTFCSKYNDICKVTLVPITYDSEGRLEMVTGVVENVADAVKWEQENHRRMECLNTRLQHSLEQQQLSCRQLQTKTAAEQENMAIIRGLSSIYFGIYLLDLEDGTFRELRTRENIHAALGSRGDAKTAFSDEVEHLIMPEFRDAMRAFNEIATMADRLANRQIISQEYCGEATGWSRASVIPIEHNPDGRATKVLYCLSDVNEERESQMKVQNALRDAYDAATAANHAKTDFLANMSHDIRTPMNGIIGMTAIAGTHIDDQERVKDCLKKITAASKHLLSLINEVLDMSKIESGTIDMSEEEFRLSDLIDNLLTMERPQIETHHHELIVNIRNVEHERVIGDSLRIQQMFVNLMSNAIKYTPDGGRILLSITEKPTNQHRVGCYEVIFEDNGIGMSEAFMKRLFEPFARANDERIKNVQGTGLGMAITRNIVRMMGGNIEVESHPDQGTRFTVTFFLKLQDQEELREKDFIDLPVLVADDDRVSMESTCSMLDELGMKAEGVLSGREAVTCVEARHVRGDDFFAVILDWKMPDMDGVAAARKIRQSVGEDVPIIILSAYDWTAIEQEARKAGVNAFISKPLFKSRLAHLFHVLVGKEDETPEEVPLLDFEHMDLAGKRVLLVEDNELNAEIAKEILEMTGLAVDLADDGSVAVDMVRDSEDHPYDLILMDIQMPRMNGYDAARAIRNLGCDYGRSVPIIAMTANAFAEDVQAALSAGMNEHIAKPLDMKALAGVLNRWVVAKQSGE